MEKLEISRLGSQAKILGTIIAFGHYKKIWI
jgi:hypothetical protein